MILTVLSVNLLSDNLLLLSSILIFVAIMVTKVGSRFGVPTLLLFLLLGMAAGSDGMGVTFEDYHLGESIGHFAMTIILFSAGLETSLAETKPVMGHGISLATLGVFLTIMLTGPFIFLIAGKSMGASMLVCILLATVMSSTDSASVFSVLRSKRLQLREHIGPMLELESGSNDPVAYMLTLILVQYLTSTGVTGSVHPLLSGVLTLFLQIVVGVAIGLGVGFGAKWLLGKIRLPGAALYSIMVLSIGFFANGLSSILYGNGLLSLYIAAIVIGDKADLPHKKEVLNFFDGMTWLMQLVMFLMLGLLARPSSMLPMFLPALLIGLFLVFIARPVSVLLSLLPFRNMSIRAKVFTSWIGLKGAGPILFALYPVVAGLEGASEIFNIVFLITLFSLLLQGMTMRPVARLLQLSYDEDPKTETFGMDIPEEMGMLRDHTVTEDDLAMGSTLRDLGLPHGIRVMMVRRGERFLVPHGSMPLQVGDRLVIVMGDSDD